MHGSLLRRKMPRKFLLPVNEGADAVAISNLPADAEDLLTLLRMEIVPLRFWQLLASEYAANSDAGNFFKLLEAGSDPDIETVTQYASETTEQVGLLCAAAGMWTAQSSLDKAASLLTRAEALSLADPRVLLARGNLEIATFNVKKSPEALLKAQRNFQVILNSPSASPSIQLVARTGKAASMYLSGQLRSALEEWSSVLKSTGSENCPKGVRLGMAACWFGLGNAERGLDGILAELEFYGSSGALTALSSFIPLLTRRDVKVLDSRDGNIESPTPAALATTAAAKVLNSSPSPAALGIFSFHAIAVQDFTTAGRAANAGLSTPTGPIRPLLQLFAAIAAHAEENFSKALLLYRSALSAQPHESVAQTASLGLAQCAAAEGKFEEAAEALAKCKDSIPVVILAAYLSVTCGRLSTGALVCVSHSSLLSRAKAVGCEKQGIFLDLMGRLARAEGDFLAAEEYFRDYLKCASPEESSPIVLNLSALTAVNGKLKEAETLAAATGSPEHELVRKYNLGCIYLEQGNNEDAISMFIEIQRTQSLSLPYCCSLLQLRNLKNKDLYTEEWDRILESEFGDFCLMVDLQSTEDLDEAIKIIRKRRDAAGGKSHPFLPSINSPYGHNFLASLYLKRCSSPADSLAALKYFSRALEAEPLNVHACFGIATVLAQRGKTTEASEILRSIAEVNQSPQVLLQLAELYRTSAKDLESARRAIKGYEVALKASVDYKSRFAALNGLGISLFIAKRFEEAAEVFAELLSMKPSHSGVRLNLAIALENAGKSAYQDKIDGSAEKSVGWLRRAGKIYRGLTGNSSASFIPTRSRACEDLASLAEQWHSDLVISKAADSERQVRAEEARRKRDEEAQTRKEAVDNEARLRREIMEREAEEKMREFREEMARVAEPEEKKTKRTATKGEGRKKRQRVEDSSSSSDSSDSSDSSSSDSEASKRSVSPRRTPSPARPVQEDVMAELFGDE